MKVYGANLGEEKVELKGLTNTEIGLTPEIVKLQNMYGNLRENKSSIEPMKLDSDGRVLIYPGLINHRCSSKIDALENISKYGILASEWFGILESEAEGRFCTFISKISGENSSLKGHLAEDNFSRLNIGNDILLF